MSIQHSDLEQIYQRQEIHELAYKVQKNNFNIRKENDSKDKRYSMPTKYTEVSSKNRINTQPIEERRSNAQSVFSRTNAFQRIMQKKEPNSQKRMYLTGSLKHRNNSQNIQYSTTQQNTDTIDIQTQKAEKCRQMAKKHHKGPINKKTVQTWLNSILMESTQFQIIDESLGNAALKKFQIDQNSLLSRAIKPQNVPRIYQSLFVHSLGFNNSIKELAGNNAEVAKNIWKVFSILLQYCAEGKFQTLIGVIEREKAIKLQQLREQVAKRQQIIQRNDELNETKNIQIFKQIRNLKQQNINLTNEKQILFQDYQKTEQAFNQQVALRLKFQNKINELFGVHRQLAVKHSRLYDDYKKKVAQWSVSSTKNTQLNQQNSDLKIQINDLIVEKQRLLNSEKYNKQLILTLKQDKLKIKDEYNIVKHQYDEERRISKQYKRRLTQTEIQIKNLTQIVSIKDKSWKQTHSQYQLSLQENNKLYNVISEQRSQVQSLLYQKKQFNNKILNLMADASFQRRKKQQFSALYYQVDKKSKQLSLKTKNLQLQINILGAKNASYEEDLKQNYQNIKKMHAYNYSLQEQVSILRKFKQSLDSVLNQKNSTANQSRQLIQKLQKQNQQLKTNLNKLQFNYKILKDQYDEQVSNSEKKYEKLRQQLAGYETGQHQKNRLLSITRLQLQKVNKFLQNTILDLKNQKFQRHNLKANYDQALAMMQKKDQNQKQLGRQISQLKDQVLVVSQQRDRKTFALQNQIIRRQRVQNELSQLKIRHQQFVQLKSSFIHPFLYEDVAQNFRIKSQKLEESLLKTKNLEIQLKQTIQKYISQLKSMQKSNKQYFQAYKKQKEKQLFLKQSQVQYEKQIVQSMKQRLDKLQQLAETYAKKVEQNNSAEKQKIYSDMIEQKSKAIDQLLSKLNIESTRNNELKEQIINKQKHYENQIISINKKHKTEAELREQKIGQLKFELDQITKQSERLKQQIKQSYNSFENRLKQRIQQYLQVYRRAEAQRMLKQKSEGERVKSYLTSKSDMQPIANNSNTKWNMMGQLQKKNPQIKARNTMAKRLRVAYRKYQHG